MEKFVTGSELRVRVAGAEYWHEIGLSDDRVIRWTWKSISPQRS